MALAKQRTTHLPKTCISFEHGVLLCYWVSTHWLNLRQQRTKSYQNNPAPVSPLRAIKFNCTYPRRRLLYKTNCHYSSVHQGNKGNLLHEWNYSTRCLNVNAKVTIPLFFIFFIFPRMTHKKIKTSCQVNRLEKLFNQLRHY